MDRDAFSEYAGPQGSKDTPITEDGSPKGQGDSIHIPAEFLQGTKFKAGDELVLKVAAVDDDGSLEVEYAAAPDKKEGNDYGNFGRMSADEEIDSMHNSDSM